MKKIQILCAVIVVLTAACNKSGKLAEHSKQPLPTGPVELKLKWPQGERVVQDMDVKMKTETAIPGQPAPMQQNVTMGEKFALTVTAAKPDGGHELEMEFLSARFGVEQSGKRLMDYDSAKKSAGEATNPVAAMFDQIIGAKLKFSVNASNDVEKVEGVDELLNRISSGRGRQDAAVQSLKTMFSESYFKQMMSGSRFLPPKPVAPGDSWPMNMELPMESLGTLELNYTITLAGWEQHGERNCARLEIDGTIKTKTGGPVAVDAAVRGMTMAIQSGASSGLAWFDPELGITTDTQMKQEMTLLMTIPANSRARPGQPGSQPQTRTTTISEEINIKLDSVK